MLFYTQNRSRNVFLPIIPMLVPPVIMGGLSSVPIIAAGGAVAVVAELSVIAASLGVGLPLAIAVFPQETEISTAALEKEFREHFDTNDGFSIGQHDFFNRNTERLLVFRRESAKRERRTDRIRALQQGPVSREEVVTFQIHYCDNL